jgi:hypothetical protein
MRKIFKFSTLVWLAAVFLAGCAAFVSVIGLSKLFAGAGITIMVMMGGLEAAKLITASALHRYWDKFSGIMKLYMTTAVIVLISITSMGIYGFLSNAYKQTADKLNVETYELGGIEAKRSNYEKTVTNLETLMTQKMDRVVSLQNIRNNQEVRLDSLFAKNQITNANKLRNDISKIENEITKLNSEVDELNVRVLGYGDSIANLNLKTIEVKSESEIGAELGPLIYISEITDLPMNKVVHYLTLIIVLVFDPLAVILLLGANRINEIESGFTPPTKTSGFMDKITDTVKNANPFTKTVKVPEVQPIETPTFTPQPEELAQEPEAQSKKSTFSDDDINKIKNNLNKRVGNDGRGFSINIPKK